MIYVIFIIFLQITELQKDWVKVAMATMEKVLTNPDKETAEADKGCTGRLQKLVRFLYLSTGHI